MKITIGSKNPAKIAAVAGLMEDYPGFKGASFSGVDVPSGVSEQPKTLEETITGAMNRARQSFVDCDYSFGLESGLMPVPHTKTGYMDFTACAIFDGQQYHLGLSSAWEAPAEVSRYMLEEGLDMNQAAYKAGLTDNPKVGSAEGLVSIVTKGRTDRKRYAQEAIRMAMIHIDN